MPLLRQEQAPALGGLHGDHAERSLRSDERQVLGRCGGQGIGAESGRAPVIEYPLSDGQVGLFQRNQGVDSPHQLEVLLHVGKKDRGAAPVETLALRALASPLLWHLSLFCVLYRAANERNIHAEEMSFLSRIQYCTVEYPPSKPESQYL